MPNHIHSLNRISLVLLITQRVLYGERKDYHYAAKSLVGLALSQC
jgi:hypothetical protein